MVLVAAVVVTAVVAASVVVAAVAELRLLAVVVVVKDPSKSEASPSASAISFIDLKVMSDIGSWL